MSRRPRAQVAGWGTYLPDRVMTNDDIAQTVDTSDEWIRERTGIAERRIAAASEGTALMATKAAEAALRTAGADPAATELIIVATVTPEYPFPATACLVQHSLGASRAGAFDLEAGCSGFVYGLAMAAAAIESGSICQALVIGAETLSRLVDWTDRNTCVLFGDGAGAVLLRSEPGAADVLTTVLGADGGGGESLIVRAGGARPPASAETVAQGLHWVQMDGRQVFKFATRIVPTVVHQLLDKAGCSLDQLDWLILHQANARIMDAAAERLKLPPERVFSNIERYGNTSAASIPIALCEAASQGLFRPGQHVALVAFGAGLTWAGALLEWRGPPPIRRNLRWLIAMLRLLIAGAKRRVRGAWAMVSRRSTR
jgi:3-oxoacyl-[acyl-carrier-protein] synthase III